MALSAAAHHSCDKVAAETYFCLQAQKTDIAWAANKAPRRPTTRAAGVRSSSFEEEPGGSQPPCLGEPRGAQERVQLTDVVVPMVQILDILVPQVGRPVGVLRHNVEQMADLCSRRRWGICCWRVFRLLDSQVPVQAIDVPKISPDRIQQRLVDWDLRRAQMAEQLVEMPEFVQSASLLQQQRAEQIVDNPVPRGCWRGGGGLQGCPTTEFNSVSCGGDR